MATVARLPFQRAAARFAMALGLAAVAACSSGPGLEPPEDEGRPYPNLSTVPPPPPGVDRDAIRAEIERLSSERNAAWQEDRVIRSSVPPSEPPAPAALAPVEQARATPAQAPAPAAVPARQPPPAAPVPTSLGIPAGVVVFPEGATRLSDAQRRAVRDAAGIVRTRAGAVRVLSHAAPAVPGEAPAAAEASRRAVLERAQVVANELAAQGIPAQRIQLAPPTPQRAGQSAALSRRIEIFVD